MPYLTLMREGPATPHVLRELFNGLRLLARTALQWHCMPHDLPLWHVLYDQAGR